MVLVSLRKSNGLLYCQSKLSCIDGRQWGCAIAVGVADMAIIKSDNAARRPRMADHAEKVAGPLL